MAWLANVVGISLAVALITWWALALLWRIGSWFTHPAEALISDYGLQVGSRAPELACHWRTSDRHLAFLGRLTFVVFGTSGCEPCQRLVRIASIHPATRQMRLVYVGDSEDLDIQPELGERWEAYRFHDERRARIQWRAPVSPYFHVIDHAGRIAAKGVANEANHLDRLMTLTPLGVQSNTLATTMALHAEG